MSGRTGENEMGCEVVPPDVVVVLVMLAACELVGSMSEQESALCFSPRCGNHGLHTFQPEPLHFVRLVRSCAFRAALSLILRSRQISYHCPATIST